MSLPKAGGLVDGTQLLSGQVKDNWEGWQQRLLRDPDESLSQPAVHAPYSDPALVRKPRVYAEFIASLFRAGLICFRPRASATVGIFFVWKKNKMQRMILDTRLLNTCFREPDHTALPTPACYAGMEIPEVGHLWLAQMDVDNAFYRIRLPAGAESYFRLPQVRRDLLCDLLRDDSTFSAELLPQEAHITPCLLVLPMGWSWSLYFCQHIVCGAVAQAGVRTDQLFLDRQPCPNLADQSVGVATYVDNVGVLGTDSAAVNVEARKVLNALENNGLSCKGLYEAGVDHHFLGLDFDRKSGRISVSIERSWKIRLALLALAGAPRIYGPQLRKILGHFTWAVLLRREMLSIFYHVYRFVDKCGDRSWRVWGSVRHELRMAAHLIIFAYCDVRRPWSPRVYVSDSQGAGRDNFGGYAVMYRDLDSATVGAIGRISEKWRYDVEDAIQARSHALELAALSDRPPPPTYDGRTFSEVESEVTHPFDSWVLAFQGRWAAAEDIMRTEGRASNLCVRHFLRKVQNHSKRCLILCDNLSLTLAFTKGRGSSIALNQCCRERCALALAVNGSFVTRWIPSERNAADGPSRALTGEAEFRDPGPRDPTPPVQPAERTAAAARLFDHIDSEASQRIDRSDWSTRLGTANLTASRTAGAAMPRGPARSRNAAGCERSRHAPFKSCSYATESACASCPVRPCTGNVHAGEQYRPAIDRSGLRPSDHVISNLESHLKLGANEPGRVGCRSRRVPRTFVLRGVPPRRGGSPHQCAGVSRSKPQGRQEQGSGESAAGAQGFQAVGSGAQSSPTAVRGVMCVGGSSHSDTSTRFCPGTPDPILRVPSTVGGAESLWPPVGGPGARLRVPLVGNSAAPHALRPIEQNWGVRRKRAVGLGSNHAVWPAACPPKEISPRRIALQHDVHEIFGPLPAMCGNQRCEVDPAAPVFLTSRGGVLGCSHSPPPVGRDQKERTVANGFQREAIRKACPRPEGSGALGPCSAKIRDKMRAYPQHHFVAQGSASSPVLGGSAKDLCSKKSRLGAPNCCEKALSRAQVRRQLNIALRNARAQSSGDVYLEVGSGTDRVASRIRANSLSPALALDLGSDPSLVDVVLGWISGKQILGVWLDPSWNSWMPERRQPMRSYGHILGRPDLPDRLARQVKAGNKIMTAVCRVIRACVRRGVPCVMMHPSQSLLWRTPSMQKLSKLRSCRSLVIDMCRFGAPWRKRTRCWSWHAPPPYAPALCPSVKGVCHTGRAHAHLTHRCPTSGQQWMQIADLHPPKFAAFAASWLIDAAERRGLHRLFRAGKC